MYTERSDQEVEADCSEAVVFEKGEDEGYSKEDHHMHIIKQRTHRVPVHLQKDTNCFNPFITDQKKVKSVPTYGDITQQQAVKLELSVYYTTLQ